MAINPSAPARPEQDSRASAIDNEIPAYRAISGMAVAGLILGLVSVLSFVDLYFLAASAAAVLAGVLADRKIRRMPEMLTGRGLAQAGIFLGLIFGLSAITHDRVDTYLRDRRINKFADVFLATLADGDVADIMWYRKPPAVRAGKSPKELHQQALAAEKMQRYEYEAEIHQVEGIKAKLARGGHLRKLGLESAGYDDLQPYGSVLVEVEGVEEPTSPHESNLIGLAVMGEKKGDAYRWYVAQLIPNRKRGETFKPAPKPVDDGHGHGH